MLSDMSLTSTGTGTSSDTSSSGSNMSQGQGLGLGLGLLDGQGLVETILEDAISCKDDNRENDNVFPPLSPPLPPVDSFTIADVRAALMECCGRTDGYLQQNYQPYLNRRVSPTLSILPINLSSQSTYSIHTSIVVVLSSACSYTHAINTFTNAPQQHANYLLSLSHSDPSTIIVPKLVLLWAVMTHSQIKRVRAVSCMGMCPGILITESLWS